MAEIDAGTEVVDVKVDFDIEERLTRAYEALCNISNDVTQICEEIGDMKLQDIQGCKLDELVGKVTSLIERVTEIPGEMVEITSELLSPPDVSIGSSLQVSSEMLDYEAFKIILKKFNLLKMRLDKIRMMLEIYALELNQKMLSDMLVGKGSAYQAPVLALNQAIIVIGQACQVINDILGVILSLINSMNILNVNGGACCFFMTPKSLQKTEAAIANVKMSVNKFIPKEVDEALVNAQESINDAKAKTKKSRTASSAAAGAASAAVGQFAPVDFGMLDKFNPDTIKTLIDSILQILIVAEPLPRYEKLSIINPRFMVYLVTGLEPAAKSSFGIPGQP